MECHPSSPVGAIGSSLAGLEAGRRPVDSQREPWVVAPTAVLWAVELFVAKPVVAVAELLVLVVVLTAAQTAAAAEFVE